MQDTFGIRATILEAWHIFKKKWDLFLIATVFMLALSWVSGMDPLDGVVPTIFFSLLQFLASFVFIRCLLDVVDGRSFGLKQTLLTIKPRSVVNYLIASMFFALLVSLGFVLLIVPGITALIALQFYGPLIVEENLGPVSALKKSYRITRGNFAHLLGFLIGLLIINILGLFAFGVGLVITIPVTYLAGVIVYKKLKRIYETKTNNQEPASPQSDLPQVATGEHSSTQEA